MDLAGPLQAFFEAKHLGAGYEILTCSTGSTMHTDQGVQVSDLAPLPAPWPAAGSRSPDLVIVPGLRVRSLPQVDPALYRWLRDVRAAGAHIASVCTGAFVLGAAGLLGGRKCTTHWSLCEELQRRFPTARVLTDRLFVTDGPITSSAGVASGIDMALSLVQSHHGPRTAAAVARQLVIYQRRDGSQPQESIFLAYRSHLHPGIHRVQDWLIEHCCEPHTMNELAVVAMMSQRNLTRRFRQATGTSISAYSVQLRLERARALLDDPSLTLAAIATRCGFSSARQLRRHWRQVFGSLPSWSRAGGDAAYPAERRAIRRR
jgi:transcriptional regulator GlxA family with amidase domain